MGGREMGSLDGQRRGGAAEGDNRFWLGTHRRCRARMVGEGVRRMMKEREG